MTEKELHKLRRQDLLQLLLFQSREADQQVSEITQLRERVAELSATVERLKLKLDDKDALIEKLKGRLDQKDETIQRLQANPQAGVPMQVQANPYAGIPVTVQEDDKSAPVTLDLGELFEVAQKAAAQHLQIKRAEAGSDAFARSARRKRR